MNTGWQGILAIPMLAFLACDPYFKNDYKDNSPTSGKLKVYHDEGLRSHLRNQAFTFEAQYPNAQIELIEAEESMAVKALLNDSCELIVLSRWLTKNEEQMFAARQYAPNFSTVAYSGIALVTATDTPVDSMTLDALAGMATGDGNENLSLLFDRNRSSVMQHFTDSVLNGQPIRGRVHAAGSSTGAIQFVADHPGTIAIIDFAWLSDADDSLYIRYRDRIKFIALARNADGRSTLPSQSSFKTRQYALTRPVYLFRKSGEFTLAKGFQSFVAGPKGQLTFLKQGLLPARQPERNIEVKFEPIHVR